MVLGNDFIPFFQGHIHLQGIDVNIAVTNMGRRRRSNAVLLFNFRQLSHQFPNLIDRNDDIFCQEDKAVITGRFANIIAGAPNAVVCYEGFNSTVLFADFVSRSYAVIQVILIIRIDCDDNVVALILRIGQIDLHVPFFALNPLIIEEFNSCRLYAGLQELIRNSQGFHFILEYSDHVEMIRSNRTQLQAKLGNNAECPFRAANEFFQCIPCRILLQPFANLCDFTSRRNHFDPVDLIPCCPVFDNAAAAGVRRYVTADFTGRLRAGIAGII